MLKSIYVDGLKSLTDFKLDFHQGLNVLIGPNGSGKSNILAALELVALSTHLDSLYSNGSSTENEWAKLFNIYSNEKRINVTVEGETEAILASENNGEPTGEMRTSLNYVFEFEIKYQPQSSEKFVFTKQKLDLQIHSDGKLHQLVFEFGENYAHFKRVDTLFLRYMAKNSKRKISSGMAKEFIENLLNSSNILIHRSAVYELSLMFQPLEVVLKELESLITYNVDPARIRKDCHSVSEPQILGDGSGLQTVLLEICEKVYNEENPIFSSDRFYENYQDVYETINFYLKQFLPDFESIRVGIDATDQKIQGKLAFADAVELPLELLSDGSLKMLTLVTILLVSKNLIVLEEPEKFLHPRMQKQIIELMRDTMDRQNDVRIFTTHCETIINKLEPEEVILTKFRKGRTSAGRFEDPEKLRNAICESGMGLGGYYVTRALDSKRLVYCSAEKNEN